MRFVFVLLFGCMSDTMNVLDRWSGCYDGGHGRNNSYCVDRDKPPNNKCLCVSKC